MTNPVAKPPRLTDIHQYNATGQLSANGAVTINGTVFHPTNGNPDAKAIGNSTSNPGKKCWPLTSFSDIRLVWNSSYLRHS